MNATVNDFHAENHLFLSLWYLTTFDNISDLIGRDKSLKTVYNMLHYDMNSDVAWSKT